MTDMLQAIRLMKKLPTRLLFGIDPATNERIYHLYPYVNCRELGFAIVVNNYKIGHNPVIIFSECRNADGIVIYTGTEDEIDNTDTWVPSDRMYHNSKSFEPGTTEALDFVKGWLGL